MRQLTKKELQLIELAEKGGKDKDLLLFDAIFALEDELKKSIQEIKDKFDIAVKDIKDNVPDLNKVLESVIGREGKAGLAGENGKQGEKGEAGKDGRNGIDGIDGKNGVSGRDGMNGKDGLNGSPDNPGQIRDKLETLKGKERLDISAIDGLEEKIKEIPERPTTTIFGGRIQPRFVKFSFTGNGATTAFTLPREPAGKGLALWAYYQGQWLQPAIHFNISKLTFTTTFTAENGTTIEGFLMI